MSTDFLVVLTHVTSLRLAKQWKADGEIDGYDDAMTFYEKIIPVADLRQLSKTIAAMSGNKSSAVIRGVGDAPAGKEKVNRRKTRYKDCKHHWVMFDIDEFTPLMCDPWGDPIGSISEYIQTHLPQPFHTASYFWQLSGSHGHETNRGVLKAHVWFWLDTPYTSQELKAWTKRDSIDVDPSVLDEIQWHYTANPVMEPGVIDPVEKRFGFVEGLLGDSVPLVIGDVTIAVRRGPSGADERDPDDDPICVYLDDNGWTRKIDSRTGNRHIRCPFEEHHTTKGSVSTTTYLPAGTNGYELGHFECHHAHCHDRTDGDFLEAIGFSLAEALNDLPDVPAASQDVDLPPFKRDSKGRIEATVDNVVKALEHVTMTGYQIGYDAFRDVVCLMKGTRHVVMCDHHYTKLRIALEKRSFKPVGRELIRDAIDFVAHQHEFDSARMWVDTLVWDKKPRAETFFIRYFGCEDTPYVRACGLYLWSAFAGRVLCPGIKADMVPILEGEQGIRKTTAVSAMSPTVDAFVEINLEEKTEDLSRKMRGALVGEIAELHGLNTREEEYIKAFITRTHERWIPKFREFATVFARRIVFIGTTNKDEILADDTGNRRWLPLHVLFADADGIAADRDQLWAEGVELFKSRGICWQDLDHLADTVRKDYLIHDPWQDRIQSWLHQTELFEVEGKLNGDAAFRTEQVAFEALDIPLRALDERSKKRIGKVLRHLGFKSTPIRMAETHGKQTRMWVRVCQTHSKMPGVVIPFHPNPRPNANPHNTTNSQEITNSHEKTNTGGVF